MTLAVFENKLIEVWRNEVKVIKELTREELELVEKAKRLGILDGILYRFENYARGLETLEDIKKEIEIKEKIQKILREVEKIAKELGWKKLSGGLEHLENIRKEDKNCFEGINKLKKRKNKTVVVLRILEEVEKLDRALTEKLGNLGIVVNPELELREHYEQEGKIIVDFIEGNAIVKPLILDILAKGKLVLVIYLPVAVLLDVYMKVIVLYKVLEFDVS